MKEDVLEAEILEPKEKKVEDNELEEEKKTKIEVNQEEKEQKEVQEKEKKNEKREEENKVKEQKEKSHNETDKEIYEEKTKKHTKQVDKTQRNNEERHSKNQKEEKKDEKQKEKKNTKKIKRVVFSIIIIFVVALLFSTVFALTNINNEKIISGVTIKGIEVSGLTKEEAIAKLQIIYTKKIETNIDLQYGEEFESELNPTVMEVKYQIEEAVNEAYSLGRNGNIFANNYNILGTLIGKKDINVNMSINEEITKQTVNDIGANLPGIMTEFSYSIKDDKLIITRGKEGIVLDTNMLISKVKEILNDISITQNVIEIPVEVKQPEDIHIDKIHEEVYKEVKDAYYTQNPFTVYPEVNGIDFDVNQAKAMIASEVKDEYVIDLIITKPNITVDQIGTEAFPDQLATFTTRYDASDKDRTTNLRLACEKLNGTVIMPGKIFSYNGTLGPRTYSAGYKNAKVYENGQVVDGIGGGICQISSTLYNAALLSDMEIVERRNHQFVTSYVDKGKDATVVYGSTDFRFKNTRTYPIKIIASAKSGIATVSIFGIKEPDREYTYSFSTKMISTIPYTTKYVEDASLASGQEVVKQKGANGLVCETYMTKRLNGKIISTKLLSRDTYSAMQRIIRRGKVENQSNKNESNILETENTVKD